jgi:branched-chain amino acid transport system permease protein
MDLIESYKEELQLIRRPFTLSWVWGAVYWVGLYPWYPTDMVNLGLWSLAWIVGLALIYSVVGLLIRMPSSRIGTLALGALTTGLIGWILAALGLTEPGQWLHDQMTIDLMTFVMIWTVGIMGQNLLIGYTGQISFGQIGFLIIGAALFGHLARAGIPWPVALLAAGVGAGLFGVLVGFPSLRLKGPYLAIATLGFGLAVHQIFSYFPALSGGRMPLDVPQIGSLFGLEEDVSAFYACFLIAGLFTLATYNIVSSYLGRAFIAIRDNDIAAEVMGVNLTFYKLLAFGISSVYVGVQGGLICMLQGSLSQNMFPLTNIFDILVGVVVGGLGLVEGSILGAGFVMIIPQFCSESAGLVPFVYGTAIVGVMIFQPLGLAGMWLKARLYVRNWPFR